MKNALGLAVFALASSSSLLAFAQDLPPIDHPDSAAAGPESPPPPPEPTLMPPPPPAPPPRLLLDKKLSGVELAGDMTYVASLSNAITHGGGYSGDLRVGYRIASGDLFFVPGVDLGYVNFTHFDGAFRGGLGGRLGVAAGVLEPSLFAYGGAFWSPFKSGLGVRAGGALDVHVTRWFVPGVHVEGDAAAWDTNSIRYVGIGAHAGFVF
jgi:hypothetical protein